MLRRLSKRSFFRKSVKPFFVALWGVFAVAFSGAVSSWLYDFLKNFPNSFFLKAFINISNIQLSLSQILLVIISFIILPLWIILGERTKHKQRLQAFLKRMKQNRLILLKKAEQGFTEFKQSQFILLKKSEQDFTEFKQSQFILLKKSEQDFTEFKQSQLILIKKIEQDFTEFIFDVFESHLDPKLIKITEFALNSKKSDPLVDTILRGLEKYFNDDNIDIASISIFRPCKSYEYVIMTHSIPNYIEQHLKDKLKFYIGDLPDSHRIGIAGFTYKQFIRRKEKMQKFFLNLEDEAFLIKIDDSGQIIEKAFPDYRPLIEKEKLKSIRTTAALPICRQSNGQAKILGVLCIDSHIGDAFKSKLHDDKLLKAAQCLAIAIEIEDLLNEFHQS